MKKLVADVPDGGLESLLGEKVVLLCLNYIYSGVLEGVSESCVLLREAAIVYETGDWSSKTWKDVQRLHCDKFYVQTSAIESFGVGK